MKSWKTCNRIPLFKALKRVMGKMLHEKVSDNPGVSFVTFVFIGFCQLSNNMLVGPSSFIFLFSLISLFILFHFFYFLSQVFYFLTNLTPKFLIFDKFYSQFLCLLMDKCPYIKFINLLKVKSKIRHINLLEIKFTKI